MGPNEGYGAFEDPASTSATLSKAMASIYATVYGTIYASTFALGDNGRESCAHPTRIRLRIDIVSDAIGVPDMRQRKCPACEFGAVLYPSTSLGLPTFTVNG